MLTCPGAGSALWNLKELRRIHNCAVISTLVRLLCVLILLKTDFFFTKLILSPRLTQPNCVPENALGCKGITCVIFTLSPSECDWSRNMGLVPYTQYTYRLGQRSWTFLSSGGAIPGGRLPEASESQGS